MIRAMIGAAIAPPAPSPAVLDRRVDLAMDDINSARLRLQSVVKDAKEEMEAAEARLVLLSEVYWKAQGVLNNLDNIDIEV